MMTIDTYIQQKNEEFLRLEIAYSNLYQAYVSGNREDMIAKYVAVGNVNIPYLTNSIYLNTKQTMLDNGVIPNVLPTSIYEIKDDALLQMNIQGCLKALQYELGRRNIYSTQHTYAQSVLYRPTHTFQQEEVLYQNIQGHQLKVTDLLAVSKYALSIAEAVAPDNEEFSKANAAITTLQGLEAILNNKSEDRPTNKMLHLVTSFLSSTVKDSLKDKEAKRNVTFTTIVLDLAIDFFCKK